VTFAAITLCVASQRVFVVVYFVIDSVRKLLVTPSYIFHTVYAGVVKAGSWYQIPLYHAVSNVCHIKGFYKGELFYNFVVHFKYRSDRGLSVWKYTVP
jgi:hypothetical protein